MAKIIPLHGDWTKLTAGRALRIRFTCAGRQKVVLFTAGTPKTVRLDDGMVCSSGAVRFADGTMAFALLELDERSSGELGGLGVFCPDGSVVWQDDAAFEATLKGLGVRRVFPYRYTYGPALPNDHHLAENGWSR